MQPTDVPNVRSAFVLGEAPGKEIRWNPISLSSLGSFDAQPLGSLGFFGSDRRDSRRRRQRGSATRLMP